MTCHGPDPWLLEPWRTVAAVSDGVALPFVAWRPVRVGHAARLAYVAQRIAPGCRDKSLSRKSYFYRLKAENDDTL